VKPYIKVALWISYLLFFTFSFFGPSLGGINVGSVSLFPARVFLIITWGLAAIAMILYRKQISFIKPKWQNLFLGIWLLLAVVSLVWVDNRREATRDLFILFMGLSLVGFAPVVVKKRQLLDWVANVWPAVFLFFVGFGIFEHLTGWHLPISRFSQGYQPHLAFRPTGVFVNENNLAVFLNLSIPFALARLRYFKSIRSRIILSLGLFLAVYLLFVTGSRINYAVLILSFLVYALLLTARGKKLRTLGILSLLLISTWLVFGVISPSLYNYNVQGIEDIGDSLEPSTSENSISIRVNLIRNGLWSVAQTKGLGIGAGNFEIWVEKNSLFSTRGILNPHNWWIELVSEYGVVIGIGYLSFYLSLLWSAWQGWRKNQRRDKWIPEALCLALVIFPFAAFSPSSTLEFYPHWLLLAVAFAWQQLPQKAGEQNAHPDDFTPLSLEN
jgi:teichuronic acid biosynthesis protein TuaE